MSDPICLVKTSNRYHFGDSDKKLQNFIGLLNQRHLHVFNKFKDQSNWSQEASGEKIRISPFVEM
jgi:hypothetical protein